MAYLMKRSSVAQIEELPLSDCSWDHEGRSFGSRKRIQCCGGAVVDSHNTDESDEEDVDEYFGDDCMFDKHDWNSSNICDLEFTWTIFIPVWLLRNIIHTIIDLGQTTYL